MSPVQQFTPEQIAQMRALLAQHDQNAGPAKEFDLNRPPKQPYRHQEFPMVIYHASNPPKKVHDQDELESHLAYGWQAEPVVIEADPVPVLDPQSAAEAAQVDAALAAARRRKAAVKA